MLLTVQHRFRAGFQCKVLCFGDVLQVRDRANHFVRLYRHLCDGIAIFPSGFFPGLWTFFTWSGFFFTCFGLDSLLHLRAIYHIVDCIYFFADCCGDDSDTSLHLGNLIAALSLINDRGEPAVSYRWTGWVWEITGWSSRLQEDCYTNRNFLLVVRA